MTVRNPLFGIHVGEFEFGSEQYNINVLGNLRCLHGRRLSIVVATTEDDLEASHNAKNRCDAVREPMRNK
jgi:hypothetical protein